MKKEYSLGLIGYPLSHSFSPQLHTAALAAAQLTGSYDLYPINPADSKGLESLINKIRSQEINGLNVTIPHKQTVIPFLDQLSPSAQAIGAVNTLYLKNGQLIGDNTDAAGFMADLEKQLIKGEKCLVLGAGGSARAVVFALKTAGWRVTVAARRLEQATKLVASFGLAQALELHQATNEHYDLIVNTTPLGMHPYEDGCAWQGDFPAGAFVYDLIYNPAETRLMKLARAAGLKATNGLGMLIEQAALAFELWTNQPADRAAMKRAIN